MKKISNILILIPAIFSLSITKKVQAISIRHDVPQTEYTNTFSSSGNYSFVGRILNGTTNNSFCSGSLLNSYYVITSAHCVFDNQNPSINPGSIRSSVQFFRDPFNQTGAIQSPVIGAVVHANYALNNDGLAHDYALLRIRDPILPSTGVSRIAPSRTTRNQLERFIGVLAGYGRNGDGVNGLGTISGGFGIAANTWHEGNDAILDPSFVPGSTFNDFSNFDRMLFADFDRPNALFGSGSGNTRASNINTITLQCAVNPARFNKDCEIFMRPLEGSPTPGDSGGAVVNNGRLVGIIQGSQSIGVPGGYGKVDRAVRVTNELTNWIGDAMRTLNTARPFRVRTTTSNPRAINLTPSGLNALGIRLYESDNTISVSSDLLPYEIDPLVIDNSGTEIDPAEYSMWFENDSLNLPTNIDVVGSFDDNPGDDNPGDDNPGDDNPGDDNPGDDNPGDDNGTTQIPEPTTIVGFLSLAGVFIKHKRNKKKEK